MRFQIKKWLRHYWHELYYKLASPSAVEFGMKCRSVVENIDLGGPHSDLRYRFRKVLHLSFCQGCCCYYSFSQSLRSAVRKMSQNQSAKSIDIEQINQELLEKYARLETGV